MSYYPPTQYRMARCLTIKAKGEAYEITHELSGRSFVLPALAYQLLTELKAPTTLEELLERCPKALAAADVEALLNRLRAGGIIVGTGDDETYHRRLPAAPLFGVPAYDGPLATDRQNRRLVLLGLPFGSGNKLDAGCARFPAKLRWFAQSYLATLHRRAATLDFRGLGADNAAFDQLRQWLTENRLTDGGDLYLQANEYPASVYAKVERLTAEISAAGNVPIMLGGDHSLTFPAISGVAKHHERLQIIQFDAHSDTYANRIADLYASVGKAPHHHGNFLSHALALPQIQSVWQYGIRGPYTLTPAADPRCRVFYAHEIPALLERPDAVWPDPEIPTYLTFDIDFFDPSLAPGTATPVIDGPDYRSGLALLEKILGRINVVGADLMEVNPEKDRDERTMQAAVGTLLRLINGIKS
ncbi:arginase family protein [Neolewinella lacunae]|uniref:Arginase family protein n=1 Tax=Neolewinella lacunae TaxID=1517758 RepID=A0A923PM74_9BACT|nr:arginase family protein [Neolewinella lacunae]MBC6996647.1 arginase family protein [Neolewinella lacunae]MDN3634788.1 arginase family protein [Neolewinella lacunae]